MKILKFKQFLGESDSEDEEEKYGAKSKKGTPPKTIIDEDDVKILNNITNKIIQIINNLNDIEGFIDSYGKIDKKPITGVIGTLNAYQETIKNELSGNN